MKYKLLTKNISYFVLAVLVIIVYKTFDSLGTLFSYIGNFFSLLSPIIWAFAIAFVLFPSCKKLETFYRKIPKLARYTRGLSVATVYVAALVIVTAFLSIMLPVIFTSITDFVNRLPSIADSVIKYLYSIEFGGYSLRPFLDKITINDIMSETGLTDVTIYLNSISSVSRGFFDIILAIIISVYILLDRAGFLKTFRRIKSIVLPHKAREIFSRYAYETFDIMYKYIYCQLLDMCVVASVAFIALIILNVEYAPILSIFIGIANLIPYFGAIVACVITSLLTIFTASFSKAVVVALVLIVLQQIDSNVIQPRIVKNALKVKPFWVLCGVLVGGGLFGILGIVLAVPVMALLKVIIDDIFDYRTNFIYEDSRPGDKHKKSEEKNTEDVPINSSDD